MLSPRTTLGCLLTATFFVVPGHLTAVAQQPTTSRVSLSSSGAQGAGASTDPHISTDGRWVAFVSDAALVPGDTNAVSDVFLRDRLTGETRRISVGPGSVQANGASLRPSMSNDGRFVAFTSAATNLTSGPANTFPDVFLHDRDAGSLRRLTTNPAGGDASGSSSHPRVSGDGRRVAFTSDASDLVTGDTQGQTDVFVADVVTGGLRRVSTSAAGVAGNGISLLPALSADARWVAFTSRATNLVAGDGNVQDDIFVRDLDGTAVERISVTSAGGEANNQSFSPRLSGDGCAVSFISRATNLVAGADDPGQPFKAFVRDRCRGTTEGVSISNAGTQLGITESSWPAITDDGCIVAFVQRRDSTFSPQAGPAALRDRCVGLTSRPDVSTAGEVAAGGVQQIGVSGGAGRYVVFSTVSANLVPGDTNGVTDVFVRDRAVNQAPVADLQVLQDGRRVTADASRSRDPDGPEVTGRISFGDGTPDSDGLRAVHEYTRGGTYTVAVLVRDADGAVDARSVAVTIPEPGAGPGAVPATTFPGAVPATTLAGPPAPPARRLAAPRLRGASLSSRRVKSGPAGRTRLRVQASERATLELRFQRAAAGRRAGGRCVARARRGTRCVRYASAGVLRRRVTEGTNSIALTGRVGSRALRPGRYRLLLVARTGDGRRSPRITLSFTVVRSSR